MCSWDLNDNEGATTVSGPEPRPVGRDVPGGSLAVVLEADGWSWQETASHSRATWAFSFFLF